MRKYSGFIKNIIIVVLAVACAGLTVRLWFGGSPLEGFFTPAHVAAANPVSQRMAPCMIGAVRLGVNLRGEEYIAVYGDVAGHEAWGLVARGLSGLIGEGVYSHTGAVEVGGMDRALNGDSIVLRYNFTMPASFFRENFGQRAGFLSSVFSGFNDLVIYPSYEDEVIMFYFINHASGNFHGFSLRKPGLLTEFVEFFENAGDAEILPRGDVSYENPIGELRLSTVENFIHFFFPNRAAIVSSVINNVYTYRDNFRVVKFFHDNVVEYSALPGRGVGAVNFTSSFLAALEMLDRDRAAMAGLEAPMNDTAFAGYRYLGGGRFVFYFDYVVGGRPLDLEECGHRGHAVEVEVLNNTVVRYRRLMLNFERDTILQPIQ